MTSAPDPGSELDPVLADLERFRAFIRPRVAEAHAVDDVLQEALLRATRGIGSLSRQNLHPLHSMGQGWSESQYQSFTDGLCF